MSNLYRRLQKHLNACRSADTKRSNVSHRNLLCERLEQRRLLTIWGGADGLLKDKIGDTWDQGDVSGWASNYNMFCPLDKPITVSTTQRNLVGCVATAEAQVAYYWQYPKTISFSSADACGYFDWDAGASNGFRVNIDGSADVFNFKNFSTLNNDLRTVSYDGSWDSKALLSFAIGVKLDSGYGTDGTGADVTDTVFHKLGYGSADTITIQDVETINVWNNDTKATVISNIKSKQPVVVQLRDFAFLSHAVVVDGYNDATDQFHVNFGWGGDADGWYSLPGLTAEWTDTIQGSTVHHKYVFNFASSVVYNISPTSSWNQVGGNQNNSSQSPYDIPTYYHVKWQATTDNTHTLSGMVVGVGGNVYATKTDTTAVGRNSLVVFDRFGTKVDEIPITTTSNGIRYPAQSSTSYIFIPTDNGLIYKVDPYTRAVSTYFTEPSGDQIAGIKIDSNDLLYVQTSNKLYCLDGPNHQKWSSPYVTPSGCSIIRDVPAIDIVQNQIYLPYYNDSTDHSYLAAINLSNGVNTYSIDFGTVPVASRSAGVPSIGPDGTVYVGNRNILYALNPNLTIKWQQNKSPSIIASAPTVGPDGTLYLSYWKPDGINYVVGALDPGTGNSRWEIPFQLGDYDSIGSIQVGSNHMIAFSVTLQGGNTTVYAYKDFGNSYAKYWQHDFSTGGDLAVGPGNTLYVLPGGSGYAHTITVLGAGQVGDPRGGGMAFTNNSPPSRPSTPGIPDGSQVTGDSVDLTWSDSDPDGHSLSYTIYVGETGNDSVPTGALRPVISALTNTSYTLSGLEPGRHYIWQIVSTDGQAETQGPTWNFTTEDYISSTRTWDGGGTDNKWSTAVNWAGNVAPSQGDNLVFPTGAARLDNVNDYPPGTVFGSIVVSDGYHIQNNAIQSTTVEVQGNAVLTATSIVCDTLTIGSSLPLTLSFANPLTFSSGGSRPNFVTAGDVNGDGKSDLVVTNEFSDNVGVLLGNDDGTFAPATTFSCGGSNPYSVAVGDFNRDGKSDLAVANYQSNGTVGILLGNSSGGFNPVTAFSAGGSYPVAVVVSDFNGDGKSDLALANYGSNNVGILLGDGSGGFGAATTFSSGASTRYVTVGDFNGDGKSDLAVSNYGTNLVRILIGNGSGGFDAGTTHNSGGSGPISISAGDFNGDGISDLAVANYLGNTVGVLLGNGSGGFGNATTFSSGGSAPVSVVVGDFNGDGKSDLAATNSDSNMMGILLGDGSGGFAPASTFSSGGNRPNYAVVSDFNRDGKSDLAVTNYNSNLIGVLLNTSSPPAAANALTTEATLATAVNANTTNSARTELPFSADVLQSIAGNSSAEEFDAEATNALTVIDSSAVREQALTVEVTVAPAVAISATSVPFVAESSQIAPPVLPVASQTITTRMILSTGKLPAKTDWHNVEALLKQPLLTELLASAFYSDLHLAARFDYQHLFSRSSLLTKPMKDSVCDELAESLAPTKKLSVSASALNRSARTLALQSIANDYRDGIFSDDCELLVSKHFEKPEKLAETAVDALCEKLVGASNGS